MDETAGVLPGRAEGGCLCGALRYVIESRPWHVLHCHCRLCRRATGAPVTTWLTVPCHAFRILQGKPRHYRSSVWGERGFCADCGTPITFQDDRYPEEIDVTLGSLDQPELFPAQRHIWTESRLRWLELDRERAAEPRESGSGS